jgi:DNA polymerase (family 10)
VFDVSDTDEPDDQRAGEHVAGASEASMYGVLDLPWIPPALREGRGEIDAAAADSLPDLLAAEDVRGDLHVHTDWSDGTESIEAMVAGAAAFGHEYVCITDHATGPGMVGGVGLDGEALRDQIDVVRTVDEDADIDVFAGVEANVGADGSVSVADDLLADLDLVVASPHASLDGDGTDRLVAAAEHPHVDVLGHPTGRLINERAGLDVDVGRLAEIAVECDTALEVNADPRRLDLRGRAVRTAVDAGATVVVDTDAHRTAAYDHVRFGVHTARRGWAETGDVLNAGGADAVRDFLDA